MKITSYHRKIQQTKNNNTQISSNKDIYIHTHVHRGILGHDQRFKCSKCLNHAFPLPKNDFILNIPCYFANYTKTLQILLHKILFDIR